MTAPVPQVTKKWRLDVNTGTTASPVWVQVRAMKAFLETINETTADPSTFDSGTWGSAQFATTLTWSVAGAYAKKLFSGAEDAGQAYLRTNAIPTGSNQKTIIEVRWYDRILPAGEAYFGSCSVSVTNSDNSGLEDASFTLNGDGERVAIANPLGTALVPLIGSALPTAVAVGGLVTITGSYFTGTVATTGVKFGGVNATSWSVVNDNKIVAVMPAGSAGSAPILVTNAAGVSASFPYTRGA